MRDRRTIIIMALAVGIPTLLILAAGLGLTDWMVNP